MGRRPGRRPVTAHAVEARRLMLADKTAADAAAQGRGLFERRDSEAISEAQPTSVRAAIADPPG